MTPVFISPLLQGLGGVIVLAVSGVLYGHRRRPYFLSWTLAWLCFVLGLLLTNLDLFEMAPSSEGPPSPSWLSTLAQVFLGWHLAWLALGNLTFLRSWKQVEGEGGGDGGTRLGTLGTLFSPGWFGAAAGGPGRPGGWPVPFLVRPGSFAGGRTPGGFWLERSPFCQAFPLGERRGTNTSRLGFCSFLP